MNRGRALGLARPGGLATTAYAGMVFVLLWPVLVGGRVLSTASSLYLVAPWKHGAASADPAAFMNPLLADQTRSFYPWLWWARTQIHAGHIPQWNPYVLSGTPFLANGQAQLFSLFAVPAWLLPLNFALGAIAALKLLAAAVGAYLLAGQLGLRSWPRFTAGLAFGFSPFFGVWLYHPITSVVALLPWMVFFVERIARQGRGWDVIGLAGAVGVMDLGGYPGIQVQLLAATGVYAAIRIALLQGWSRRARARRLAQIVTGLAVGLALAAFLLIPVATAIPGTAGIAVRANGGGVEPAGALRTLFFPDWWGRPSEGLLARGPDNYNLRTFYAGTVTLLLAALAVVSGRDWRLKAPLLALLALGLVIPIGVQPVRVVLLHIPLLNHSQLKLTTVLEQFSLALLAGFGLRDLLAAGRRPGRALAVAAAGLAVPVLAVLLLAPGVHAIHLLVHYVAGGPLSHFAAVLALASIVWWLAFAAVFAVAAAGMRWLPPSVIALICVLGVAADSVHFFHGYQPMPPAADVYPGTPAIRFLQQHQGAWRIAALSPALPADAGLVYGLRDVRGLDPPQPTTAYAHLVRLGQPISHLVSNTHFTRVTANGIRVLDLLGVRYLLTSPHGAVMGFPSLHRVYAGHDATVFENSGAVPRATIPSVVLHRPTEDSALRAIAAPGFRPRVDAVTSRQVPAGRGTVAVISDSGDQVQLQASMSRPGLVVLADQYAPGWSVSVDGRPAPIVRTDVALRGVVVGAGRHRVVWSYQTPGLRLGLAVSTAALAVLNGWGILRIANIVRQPDTSTVGR